MAEKVLHEFEWGGYGYRIAEGAGEREGWGPRAQMRNGEGHWFDWTGGHRPLVREILHLRGLLEEVAEYEGVFRTPLMSRIRQALHREGEE